MSATVPSITVHAALYLALAATCVGTVIAGAILHRSGGALPWQLFAIALTLFFVGDLFFYYYDVIKGQARPFPSLADGLYLSSYPFMIAGTAVLIRRRGRAGPGTLIDASMIAIGVGVLFWVFVIEPVASTGGQPMLDRLISTAYPVMDVLLLAVTARLAVMPAGRRPTYTFLGIGAVGLLVADAASGLIQLSQAFHTGTVVDAGWMVFYLCWAVSALHPSAYAAEVPVVEQPDGSHWTRMLVLTAVCLLAPAVLAVRWATGAQDQAAVLFATSLVLFVLAQARMFVLSRTLASTAARERSLRNSAASFVTAIDVDGVRVAALAAVRAVVERPDAVFAMVEVDGRTTVALADDAAVDARPTGVPGVAADGSATFAQLEAAAFRLLGDAAPAHAMSAQLYAPTGLRGVLVIGAATPFAAGLRTVIETLGSQIALALESAALRANLLRQEGEVRFRSLVQNSLDVITLIDCDALISYQSPSLEHVLGYPDGALLGTSLLDLVHTDDVGQTAAFVDRVTNRRGSILATAHRLRHRDGAWLSCETVGNNLLDDPSVSGIVLTTRDVSERQAFEARLLHQAFHDPLTGIANRLLFADRVDKALAQRRSSTGPLAVIFLDLDDYKSVNDSLGHHAGDEVLITVAARLGLWVRGGDTIARMGGDEFAVLLPGMDHRDVALEVAERIGRALDEPFVLDGKEVVIGASLGIAYVEGPDQLGGDVSREELLRNADVAMYTAKSRGKRRYEVYEAGMHSAVLERLQFKADLQRAFDHDEFVLYYQPIISAETELMTGVEALVRWHSAERGIVPPGEFIPLCEETGLILPLGAWVLTTALAQAERWSFAARSLSMSVNLSAMQLQQPALTADVVAALAASGVPARVLTLELTESMLMTGIESSIAVLQDLRALGVRLVIDDFGTGYSSLSYLRQLPIDGLKIDKEFVDGIRSTGEDALLLITVVELARSLG
ncbi:MAG: EAL domain-containing protein, partial [Ilumatobacteraceae bacterium]